MSSPAREEVLRRIRAATAGSSAPAITREYRETLPADIDLLVDRLEDYRAVVHRCQPTEVAAVIAAALAAARVTRVATPARLDPALLAECPRRSDCRVLADDGTLVAADLDGDDVGVVTTCAVAIAETGTIVLDGGAGQGRRLLTLVPDHHLCVVGTDQVVGSVPDAFRVLDPLRPLTWISGPSATSDIELRRVEGVHGPRHLVVILVDRNVDQQQSQHEGASS
jgi:L-lactate dehydrogenase complex protein LldG